MKANDKIQVTEIQYKNIVNDLSGLIFHTQKEGKFFIKIVSKKFNKYLLPYLN
jgi:hypothetical protein